MKNDAARVWAILALPQSGDYCKRTMKHNNGSSKSTSRKEQNLNPITLGDVPNVLLEIEGRLIELDEQGTAEDRQRLNQVIQIFAALADRLPVLEVAA